MILHILLMNVLGPIVALAVARLAPQTFKSGLPIALPTVGQLGLLWAWHAPPVLAATMASPTLHMVMQVSLFTAAVVYWLAVIRTRNCERWRAIASLLFTSKLFCLLAVLYVFAPRALHPDLLSQHTSAHGSAISTLTDQQLSGLLMLAACPLTYLAAGVWIAARWLAELGLDKGASPAPARVAGIKHSAA